MMCCGKPSISAWSASALDNKSLLKKHSVIRKTVQGSFGFLQNANVNGFLKGTIYQGPLKRFCVPGMNCYSCPGAVASCPLGSLQTGLLSSRYKYPYYILGTILLLGIILGRFICGFLCPFGLFQELIYKIPLPKLKKNRYTRALSYMKYIILIFFVIAIPLVKLEPGFCKYICPAGTMEAGIPLVTYDPRIRRLAGYLFSWKVFILAVVILACIICYRSFCRFICPLGAIYSFFAPVSAVGYKVDMDRCINCSKCVESCLVDIHRVGDRECIHCGACVKHCPVDAIKLRGTVNKEA